jgi:hypothetical protein
MKPPRIEQMARILAMVRPAADIAPDSVMVCCVVHMTLMLCIVKGHGHGHESFQFILATHYKGI